MQHSTGLLIFAAISFIVICIFGTVGNLLVGIALATSGSKHSATTLLVINLSLCILPICALTMPYLATLSLENIHLDHEHGQLSVPEWSMKAFYVLTCICNQVELHTIAAIAFNRACAVVAPNFFKRYLTKKRIMWIILVLIWVYSVILWIPVTTGKWGYLEVEKHEYFVEVKDDDRYKVYISLFFCFVLPFQFTVICQIVLYVKFRKTRMQGRIDGAAQMWENHVTRTMKGIFLLLIICSVPHFVVHYLKRFGSWPKSWVLGHILYFSRFCLNPAVYIYTSNKYRSDCINLMKRIKEKREAFSETSRDTKSNPRRTDQQHVSKDDTTDGL